MAFKTAKTLIEATSVFELVEVLKEGGHNLVRFPHYDAADKGDAALRRVKGESGRGKGKGVGHYVCEKSHSLAWNAKGHKPSVIMTIRDMTTRKNTEYDFRTRTVASLFDNRIKTIEVCDNFETFREVSLKGLRVFPEGLENPDEIADKLLEALAKGRALKELDSAITALKKKVNKETGVESPDGSKVIYNPPEGTTTKVVHAETEEGIKSERVTVEKISFDAILPPLESQFPGMTEKGKGRAANRMVLSKDLELLPFYMKRQATLRDEYKSLMSEIFPWVMGIVETEMSKADEIPSEISIGETVFGVSINTDTESHTPEDLAEKLESGEYKEIKVPKRNGSWELIEAAQTV